MPGFPGRLPADVGALSRASRQHERAPAERWVLLSARCRRLARRVAGHEIVHAANSTPAATGV